MNTQGMQHPYEKLSPHLLWGVYWLAFIANFTFMFVFAGGGHPHTEEAKAAGIHYSTLDVELSRSPEQVEAIREALGEKGRASMANGAATQLLWPFFYANAMAAGIVALYRGARFKGRTLKIARAMAWGAWFAGASDFVENLTIILMLNGTYATPIPQIKFVITVLKFGILIIALLYLLGAVGWNYRQGVIAHPLAKLSDVKFKKSYTALFIAVLVLSQILGTIGKGFSEQQDADGKSFDILAFEFAKTPAQAQAIVDTWGESGIAAAKWNTLLDYLFLALYSTVIAMGVLALASGAQFGGIMAWLAVLLAWGQWIAAFCDAIENTCLMMILNGSVVSPWPEIAYWCASVKFGIIFSGLAFILGLLPCVVRSENAEEAILSGL